tara:strand:- start:666 stop:911 length:246 start_codon:yes stop_codon:yes gene_type:complete
MNIYQFELSTLRPDDEMQGYDLVKQDKGYHFIPTASHGYLVVPITDKRIELAKKICSYGYQGKKAVYLEEDVEALEFLRQI